MTKFISGTVKSGPWKALIIIYGARVPEEREVARKKS